MKRKWYEKFEDEWFIGEINITARLAWATFIGYAVLGVLCLVSNLL